MAKFFPVNQPMPIYPTGNFNNFQTAFNPLPIAQVQGYDPKVAFNNYDFNNNNNLRYNNLKSSLLNEDVREYSVMIDSKDRNYQVYPDPFSYEVKFHPLPKTREKVGDKYVTYEEPAPTINDNFVKVKYIRLEEIILPYYNRIREVEEMEENENGEEELIKKWQVHVDKPITDNLYVVLSIGAEFSDENYRSTNDVLGDSFATVYYNNQVNKTHFFAKTHNGNKIFRDDQLGKIDRFRIKFTDPYGQPLRCPHVDKRILSNMECNCDDPEGDDDTDCFKHNLFHPLNPIFQHHLHFKVGVVEPRLNKLNFH